MIGIVGLFLAIVILIIGAYKGLGPLPLTLLAAVVALVTNSMDVWAGISQSYISGYVGAYSSYFLIFMFSALYAKLMDESGSAAAVGYKLVDWFGKKYVILVSILVISVLTYGGVSLFVVVFAAAPIMFMLLKEANLPRHLTLGIVCVGSCTYTMTSLPGTPQLTNIVPTQYLGTTMTAAPVLSIIISVVLFVLGLLYMRIAEKRAVAAGEGWTYPESMDPARYELANRDLLPPAWKAFLPIIVLLSIIIIGGRFISDSTLLTVVGMLIAAVLCYCLNFESMKTKSLSGLLTNGLGGGVSAIGGIAAVVAFGTVVQSTVSYQSIVDWLLSLDMHPYLQGVLSTAVISGITGSSSGGLRLTYSSLAEHFIASGCNLETLHRLMSVAAGSLDTLPHSAGLFLTLQLLGLTHKSAYRHMFWTSVFIPAVVVIIFTVICILGNF